MLLCFRTSLYYGPGGSQNCFSRYVVLIGYVMQLVANSIK